MSVALYARVSTDSQQARGTIGSQLAVLRDRVGAEGCTGRRGGRRVLRQIEFCDDGHCGALTPGPARARRAARRRGGRADRAGVVPVPALLHWPRAGSGRLG